MEKYSLDTICTGNHKADHINSRIMELADDIAEVLASKDWEAQDRPENFWIEEENGDMRMNAEAHEIWEVYYDKYVDILYSFANKVIEIDAPTTREKEISRLGHYVSENNTEQAYDTLLKANEDG